MPKKMPPKEMLEAVSGVTIEALRNIEQLYVSQHHDDAMGAVTAGAVLLAIARVDNDKDGDGFRYLIGLRKGTEVTAYLTNFFERRSRASR